jgi:hypothetical protein
MQKAIFYIIIFLFSIQLGKSQPGANHWINYNQQYFAFKVVEKGIYRIDRNTLKAISNQFITVNPQNLQVFARGVEQPIYVHGENDLSFDAGDYIELYCRGNDGFLDSLMYDDPSQMTNPYYSLINDTITYYITWENSPTSKKRFNTYSSSNYSSFSSISSVKQIDYYGYTSAFYHGQSVASYSSGKGWFEGNDIVLDGPISKTLYFDNQLSNGNIKVSYSVCGAPNSVVYSNLNHKIKVYSNDVIKDSVSYTGYQTAKKSFNVPASELGSNQIKLNFSSNFSFGSQPDRNALAYIILEYNRSLDFDNKGKAFFYVLPSSSSKRLSLSSFSNTQPHIYNLTTKERTIAINNSGNWEAVINNDASNESEVVAFASDSIINVTNIDRVIFDDYASESSPKFLIVYHKSLESSVNDYASYRTSQGYNVLKAEISQLYHQFAYGIEKHPMAIKNYVRHMLNVHDSPEYLFLIGKATTSLALRKDSASFANCLVPTMGEPPSDVLLTSGLVLNELAPALATGRLAARNNADVEMYLDKIVEYESNENALWQKQALHFGGGSNTTEQNTFKNYLKEYEQMFGDTIIGGIVTTFLKNSSDPIQISVSDSVEILINNGASMLSFFGHGSTGGFDQNIDEPDVYNNEGKYPFIIANSCHSGDIHLNTSYKSISEKWLLIDNKGAIGFLAASDVGYASQLHSLTKEFYRSLTSRKYGVPIGKVIKDGMLYYSAGQISNQFIKKTILDNTLHGDPSVKLFSYEKPDLIIESSGVTFYNQPITSAIDSFEVEIEYFNLGKAFVDSFSITVERIFPDGETEIVSIQKQSCYYSDAFNIKLPTKAMEALGVNRLRVQLDYLDQIEELQENNNTTTIDFFVQSNDIIPVYPYEFSVVSNQSQILKASSGNPFEQNVSALFQIDTTDTFDSPFLRSESISVNGGLVEWNLPFALSDSTVYFWRVKKENTDNWRETSFRYIQGQEGWSQAHHFQMKGDDYQFINYKKAEREFEYITTPKTLLCRNIGSVPGGRLPELGFWIDGNGDTDICGGGSGITVVVIDSLTLEPWRSNIEDFGHRDFPKCYSRSTPDRYFQFYTEDSLSMENFAAMLNTIPNGKHVLIYTIWNGNFNNVPDNAKTAIEQLYPGSQFRYQDNYIPYILYVQKGIPVTAQEVIGSSTTDEITLSVDLKTNFVSGSVYSKEIGPSLDWHSFHWTYKNNIDQKRTELKIIGIDQQSNEHVLIDGINKDSLNILDLSSRIDAQVYPYLKLQMFTKDSISKVPTQLESWTLLYDEVPETAINITDDYYFYSDTVAQGEDVTFAISTENISSKDMDSLMVTYFVRNSENIVQNIRSTKLRPHPALDVLTDTVVFNTVNSRGQHTIWVEFNPIDSATGDYYQVEKFHHNNIAQKYFYVEKDNTNPLLNVTFDGVHIMDGDIVSPNPEILIKINDENAYLVMDDPEIVSIYLKRADQQEERRVTIMDSLSNQQLFWTPSSLPDNVAEMLFTPRNLEDGIYTLIVGATDASANESGDYDYQITFEVVNKSTITEVLNYPNPFSTSTQFVFTLTGSEIPEEIVVQVMTVTGKVVKEINLSEVSSLRIGRNITDYKWDGRDTYGDLLANGVYFYRLIVKNAGEKVELNATQASKYFKQGIGKMYIIR